MTTARGRVSKGSPAPRGDAHNFGRHVERRGRAVYKPRTLVWERLLLSAKSPLRRCLDRIAATEGLAPFDFLPDLRFSLARGEVDVIDLLPVGRVSRPEKARLARVAGSAVALFSFLGVEDLHWENLALGRDRVSKRILFAPLDVEMILADLSLPAQTRLLPEVDDDLGEVYRHAAGLRRLLPFLGKPVDAPHIVAIAGAYHATFTALEAHARSIAEAFSDEPHLRTAPLRVTLRGTGEYVRAPREPMWPPLLEAEAEQLARGDIPYFFRLYGAPGIRFFSDAELRSTHRLPTRGDVPTLAPLLSVARGLRSPARRKLRELGVLTILGALDHPAVTGVHTTSELEVTFAPRTLRVRGPGLDVSCPRDLRAVVGSLYLPCRCGEVRLALVPPVTACQ